MGYDLTPLANGIRTDHPVPGLPFIDDSHIPLDEGPEAIEAVGRHEMSGMWGRFDHNRQNGGWRAFTTDPMQHSLGWSVRYHPDHGRTVLLMPDNATSGLHSWWSQDELLFRAGGYWWNGETWYRPGQVWDPVEEGYERRKARAAVTVSAADMLDGRSDSDKAYLGKVTTFDPEDPAPENWLDHLALWAARHQEQADPLPLEECVVDLASPELTGSQLLGVPEMAELGGISASTLRAYISRGNNEVPQPQATVNGRAQWARAVAQDWTEARERSSEGIRATMSAGDRDNLSPGAAHVRNRLATDFHETLWGRPDVRKRWVLRQRNEESVREVSDALAWSVAANLDQILPPTDVLGSTIEGAVLDDFADFVRMRGGIAEGGDGVTYGRDTWLGLNLTVPVAKMLDWFIRHFPDAAHWRIGYIQREAHKRWGLSREDTVAALRRSLSLDGELSKEARETYFALLAPPKHTD